MGQFTFRSAEELGAGGLGRVDRVEIITSTAASKPVGSAWARKRLNEKWATHPTMLERFEREIRAMRSMSHPHIMAVEGENIAGGERFYMMPIYTSSVRKHIASGGWRGNWRAIAKCGVALASALQYAHEKGFIHRDLKPDNILYNADGPLVIADWGLGYFVHKNSVVLQPLTIGGMGTEYYCSLEQWATGKCDARGDIYSLGMTLDEWVRGTQTPLQAVGSGVSWSTVSETSPGARAFNAAIQVFTQAIHTRRPSSMAEAAQILSRAAATA
jgi:serine/threonine protein kinase